MSANHILTTHVGSLPRDAAVVEHAVPPRARRGSRPGCVPTRDGDGGGRGRRSPGRNRTGRGQRRRDQQDRLRDLHQGPPIRLRRRFAAPGRARPRALPRVPRTPGGVRRKAEFKRMSCIGPIAVTDRESLHDDLANLRAAVHEARAASRFPERGVARRDQRSSSPTPTTLRTGSTSRRSAAAMQEEYEAIVAAGFDLQLDARTSRWRATPASRPGRRRVPAQRRPAGRGDEPRAAQRRRAGVRMHVCWGNYEGPHDHDIASRRCCRWS
jgi:hypothetical protein